MATVKRNTVEKNFKNDNWTFKVARGHANIVFFARVVKFCKALPRK